MSCLKQRTPDGNGSKFSTLVCLLSGAPIMADRLSERAMQSGWVRFFNVICVCVAHLQYFFNLFLVFFSPGYNPVFDETFEFHINLPDLALVRFVVQDDDFIGDGFIGQYTIPLNCIQPGNAQIRRCGGFHSSKRGIAWSLLWHDSSPPGHDPNGT